MESYWAEANAAGWPVTTFQIADGEAPEAQCLNILTTVLEHHGPYSQRLAVRTIEVVGALPDPDLRAALADAGFGAVELTPMGFRATAV